MINKKRAYCFGETEIVGTFLAQFWRTQL